MCACIWGRQPQTHLQALLDSVPDSVLDFPVNLVRVANPLAALGLADLKRLQLTRCAVDVEAQRRLALQQDLTAYDAAYLWLAAERGAPLATFDAKLGEAAQRYLKGD